MLGSYVHVIVGNSIYKSDHKPGDAFLVKLSPAQDLGDGYLVCALELVPPLEICPDCGQALDVDPENLNPPLVVYWCENCEEAYDGTGAKL